MQILWDVHCWSNTTSDVWQTPLKSGVYSSETSEDCSWWPLNKRTASSKRMHAITHSVCCHMFHMHVQHTFKSISRTCRHDLSCGFFSQGLSESSGFWRTGRYGCGLCWMVSDWAAVFPRAAEIRLTELFGANDLVLRCSSKWFHHS